MQFLAPLEEEKQFKVLLVKVIFQRIVILLAEEVEVLLKLVVQMVPLKAVMAQLHQLMHHLLQEVEAAVLGVVLLVLHQVVLQEVLVAEVLVGIILMALEQQEHQILAGVVAVVHKLQAVMMETALMVGQV